MRLRPVAAPGHLNRKAREFEDEIAQLWSQGYTLSAIRESLAAVGVQVSLSAVWREVSRSKRGDPKPRARRTMPSTDGPVLPQGTLGTASSADVFVPKPFSPAPAADRRSGKEIAEEFRRQQTTNPLLRAKEQR